MSLAVLLKCFMTNWPLKERGKLIGKNRWNNNSEALRHYLLQSHIKRFLSFIFHSPSYFLLQAAIKRGRGCKKHRPAGNRETVAGVGGIQERMQLEDDHIYTRTVIVRGDYTLDWVNEKCWHSGKI